MDDAEYIYFSYKLVLDCVELIFCSDFGVINLNTKSNNCRPFTHGQPLSSTSTCLSLCTIGQIRIVGPQCEVFDLICFIWGVFTGTCGSGFGLMLKKGFTCWNSVKDKPNRCSVIWAGALYVIDCTDDEDISFVGLM